jgi:hypothetical protein
VAVGPDIKAGFTSTTTREQIDIAPTIASMMGFTMPTATGKVMTEILEPATIAGYGDEKAGVQKISSRISVTTTVNRSIFFSNLPADASIDIMDMTGSRLARIPADSFRRTAVWRATGPSGMRTAAGYYFCRIKSKGMETMQVAVAVP